MKKLLYIVILFLFCSCERSNNDPGYLTKNVIIVVIDGARYSETWGDSTFSNIPNQKLMTDEGILFTDFYNNGPTLTVAGHVALTTGNYQQIDNSGLEVPKYPSIFQYFNKSTNTTESEIITSKDKLSILAESSDSAFNGKYRPVFDCGINGLGVGSGVRNDSITFIRAVNSLKINQPRLLLISFRDPDYSGHQANWENYIKGIRKSDFYVSEIWKFVSQDNYYKNSTSIFITNDHGRHLDNVSNGFVSHGDTCLGCRHISLLALGPDFRKGEEIITAHEIIDIPATISAILKFKMPTSTGCVLNKLFK